MNTLICKLSFCMSQVKLIKSMSDDSVNSSMCLSTGKFSVFGLPLNYKISIFFLATCECDNHNLTRFGVRLRLVFSGEQEANLTFQVKAKASSFSLGSRAAFGALMLFFDST